MKKNLSRELLGQRKIKRIYLKYLKRINIELKKYKSDDTVLLALLFAKLTMIIDDLYREIIMFISADVRESMKENFIDSLLLAGLISELHISPLSITNKVVGKNITQMLVEHRSLLKRQIYSQLYDFVETGYQIEKIDDIIYNRKGQLLSGDISKTLRLYRTESTRLRTEAKLEAVEAIKQSGYSVYRQWLYTWESITPRQHHVDANGLREDSNGYFSINGYRTKGPGLFGVPSEDINCRCDTAIYVDERQ